MIPTACLSCLADVFERDARGLCPDCAAERAGCDDHPGSCSCAACQRWAALDAHLVVLLERAAEWSLDREVSL